MVADGAADKDPSIIDRWLSDQQQWQRTILAYLDSMAKNEDFLVHLGNAMRGSLLAGKPYPSAPPSSASVPSTPADDRIDQLHYAVHQMEGQLQDVRITLDEIRQALARVLPDPIATTPPSKTAPSKTAPSKTAPSKTAPSRTAPSRTPPSRTASSKTRPPTSPRATTTRPKTARRAAAKSAKPAAIGKRRARR
jgi:hypothetical protein